jgi:hypothetical protein
MMAESRFDAFLGDSLRILSIEAPEAYREMCRVLLGREVGIEVDGCAVGVLYERERAVLLPEPRSPAVDVKTTRDAILALVDARISLVDAALRDALQLRGSPGDLLAFLDGLAAYLHGSVRAPSFPALLRRYRKAG